MENKHIKKRITLPLNFILILFLVIGLSSSVYADSSRNEFIRGDSNADGKVDISDASNTLNFLFSKTGKIICQDAADANDDGSIDISDAVKILMVLFSGQQMPGPFPNKGKDMTVDELNCNPRKFVFKFYLDPVLVPDIGFAKRALVEYVRDINYILSKNTDRELIFNPETDIILTKTKPQTDYATPPLPDDSYEVWAYAVLSNFAPAGVLRSYGGRVGIDVSGAAVLTDLKWAKIYDVARLIENIPDIEDYWTQINNMVHELEHTCGAGAGEYYSLAQVDDTTGLDPKVNIRASDPADPYWASKADFMTDPLLWNIYGKERFGNPRSRSSLLEKVKLSELSANVCNGNYRNGAQLPNISAITMKVLRKDNRQPINGANVKIWSVSKIVNPPKSVLLYNLVTDNSGEIIFDWAGGDLHSNVNLLRTIKVYKEGFTPAVKHISVFDAERAKIIDNKDLWVVEILM